MRIACIIQARMGSKRLPGKVKMDIAGRPMIWHVEQRARAAAKPSPLSNSMFETVVAWPFVDQDENDVLGRYARIATDMSLDAIIRVTGDCPLLDPKPIQTVLYLFQTLLYDYVTNDMPRTYPCGLGIEIFSRTALDCADKEAILPYDREHVSPFIQRDKRNTVRNIRCPINGLSDLKLSVDTHEDLGFVRAIYAAEPKDHSLAATLEAIERVKAQNYA